MDRRRRRRLQHPQRGAHRRGDDQAHHRLRLHASPAAAGTPTTTTPTGRSPSDLDIDHLVPLAEAWDSGARNWTAAQRQAYANDLGDARALVAVTDNVNQAKGDQDPAEWMPPAAGATCRYVGEWAAVKIRWRLTVDTPRRAR